MNILSTFLYTPLEKRKVFMEWINLKSSEHGNINFEWDPEEQK